MSDLRIVIASHPEREHVFAEIHIDGPEGSRYAGCVAHVEGDPDRLELELPGLGLAEEHVVRVVDLELFLQAVEQARSRLRGESILRPNLIQALRDLSDATFQELAWTGRLPGVVSFFTELVCTTFDDTGLSDAIRSGCVESQLGADAAREAARLHAAVRKVDQALPVLELVRSPGMVRVRRCAAALLRALEPGGLPGRP
jgi:hypothetical protein